MKSSDFYDFAMHKVRTKANVVAEATAKLPPPKTTAPPHMVIQYRQYQEVLEGHLEELMVLQELHEQNWQDFRELKGIGHSEIDNIRKGIQTKRLVGLMIAGLAGLFSGFSLFSSE